MQTLGLTMATAATDAGADSALQPNAAAPTGAGAIFEILMTAASDPTTDNLSSENASLPAVPAPPVPMEATSIVPAAQMPASNLASDMEQMVQALAITAEVVAQGMAARTTPVREIILTVETPKADVSADTALPQLNVILPTPSVPGPSLTVSDADPEKNLDPELIAHLPPLPKMQAPASQIEEPADVTVELIETLPALVENTAPITEMTAPQASSPLLEEAYGPWRAEIHGPVLNAQRELITQPVYAPVLDAQEPVVPPAMVSVANIPVDLASSLPVETQTALPIMTTDMPIRVVTIHVPVQAKAPSEAVDPATDEITIATTHSEPTESTPPEVTPTTSMIIAQIDFIGPQMLTPVTLDLQPSKPTQTENESLPDALNAPRPAQSDAHVFLVTPARSETVNLPLSTPTAPPVLTQSAAATPGMSTEAPVFDVAAVVEALHRDADLTRVAHRRDDDVRQYASLLETNIPNPVAKTSSRTSNDIRDLMKLGVRDIEIVQATGRTQDMHVSPQLQSNELSGASASARAQVADAFAPTGNEANTAERRAQAHETRMRAIERQVVAAVRDGTDTIRMQLYPPGLGQIIIRLTMDGSKLKLSTSASSRDAADSLRTLEGDLRDALSVGGLELTGFDVSEDGDGGHKNRKNTSETDNINQQSRSAKSDDFALDMNA